MNEVRARLVQLVRGLGMSTWMLGGALACGGPPHELDDGGGESDARGSSSTDDGETLASAPVIAAAPEVVGRGTRLYVLMDLPMQLVELELAGRVLDGPRQPLLADVPGVIVPVPADLPLGPTMLVARRRDEPSEAAEHPLELVEPRFVDVAAATGLAQTHDVSGAPPDCAESHTGLAFGDWDGDGRVDAFVGHVGGGGRLHRNLGDRDGDGLPDFEDATAAAGLAEIDAVAMATFVDLEGDGDQDLFVGRRGENRMLVNHLVPDGEPVLADATAALGLARQRAHERARREVPQEVLGPAQPRLARDLPGERQAVLRGRALHGRGHREGAHSPGARDPGGPHRQRASSTRGPPPATWRGRSAGM